MPTPRWRLSAETVTALAAVLTAVIALGVGVWQTAETRRHNRLSVRPLLDYRIAASIARPDSVAVRVELANRGLGVALVEGMEIRVETRPGGEAAYATWEEARPALEAFGLAIRSQATVDEGVVIEPGQTLDLLTVSGSDESALQTIVDRLEVEVAYTSLYEEPFVETLGD